MEECNRMLQHYQREIKWEASDPEDGGDIWDIKPCSQLNVDRRFGRTHRFHYQDRKKPRKIPAWKQVGGIRPWRWRRYVLPKRRLTFNGLHSVIVLCSHRCVCVLVLLRIRESRLSHFTFLVFSSCSKASADGEVAQNRPHSSSLSLASHRSPQSSYKAYGQNTRPLKYSVSTKFRRHLSIRLSIMWSKKFGEN
jgi:hypothetical protein